MRIGLLSFELTVSGGEQRQLLWLARELQEMGHDVAVYAYRYNAASCYPALAHQLDIRRVRKVADPVLTPRSSSLGRLSFAAQRYFFESRVLARMIESVDILNPHGRPAHRSAVIHKRKTGTPIVWTCNDVVSWEKDGHRARLPSRVQAVASRLVRPLEQNIARHIDIVAVLDHNVQKILESSYQRPTRVVRSGVDTRSLQERPEGRRKIRSRYGIANETFLLLWLGVLEPFRRLEDLLEAVSILRQQRIEVRVLVVGRHDAAPLYFHRLLRLAAEKKLDSLVRFDGQSVPEDELADYYSACDVLIYPNDHQAWGLAPLEALACRRPVIVSSGSGVHEVLVDGETALLVPPKEPKAIAAAVRRLIECPELRKGIGQQGHDFVARHLSWQNYASRMLGLFEESLQSTVQKEELNPAVTVTRESLW